MMASTMAAAMQMPSRRSEGLASRLGRCAERKARACGPVGPGRESATNSGSGRRHASLPSRSPRMPVGRKSSSVTSTPKETTSCHSADIQRRGMLSNTPSNRPPIIAPRMLPMPPRTAAVNALRPGNEAHRVYDAELESEQKPGHAAHQSRRART